MHFRKTSNNQTRQVLSDIEEPEQFSQSLKPEIMDTHAQHLHKAPGKGIWHYIFEFIMLFLAVFCGFLAENIRENKIEGVRATEFSKSLIQDLQNDIIAIHAHQNTASTYMSVVDSLLSLSQTKLVDRNSAKFSFYTRFAYWTSPLVWNRATFEQIKNSGSLRYFKNQSLLGKIMKYINIGGECPKFRIKTHCQGVFCPGSELL